MEDKKKKKKAPSARARLTKSLGFGKRPDSDSDSDSDGTPFAAEVQSSWQKEDGSGGENYELVVEESVGVKKKGSSRSRRAAGDRTSAPRSPKKSSKKKASRKAEGADASLGEADSEDHTRHSSLASGEAAERTLQETKKGGSKEALKKGKSKGKGLVDLGSDLASAEDCSQAPGRERSSSFAAKCSRAARRKGSLGKSERSRASPRKGRKAKQAKHAARASSAEADQATKEPPCDIDVAAQPSVEAPMPQKQEAREECAPRTPTVGALDDQPVEFADERRRRHNPLKLRRSASLSKLMETDEMAAMRGASHARGLFASRDAVSTSRGLVEADDAEAERESSVLHSKPRSGWRSLLKKSQLSRLDLKRAIVGKKSKSQSELSRAKGRKGDRSSGLAGSAPPNMAYRDAADINSIESLKLLLAGDERLPSFRKFLDATYR